MQILDYLIGRFLGNSVDSVLGVISRAIGRLERLQDRKVLEAGRHQEAANESLRLVDEALTEARRAGNVRDKLTDLIS